MVIFFKIYGRIPSRLLRRSFHSLLAMTRYPLVFIGTAAFGIPVLQTLAPDRAFKIIGIFTQPDQPTGRHQTPTPSPIKIAARKLGLPIYQGDLTALEHFLQKTQPEIALVIAFGEKIPKNILKIPKKGCINLHASLLPHFRGASPIQSALLHGDTSTGLTLIQMNERMDAGDILAQTEIGIEINDNYATLQKKLSGLAAPFVKKSLEKFVNGQLFPQSQKEKDATSCYEIRREDGRVNFHAESAEKIIQKFRAFTPWPGIFTFLRKKRLKILEISHESEKIQGEPGKIFKTSNTIGVYAKKDAICLKTVQLEGKKPLEIHPFVLGMPSAIGAVLE